MNTLRNQCPKTEQCTKSEQYFNKRLPRNYPYYGNHDEIISFNKTREI